MKLGTTRDITLSVARPLADVTGFLQLNEPRKGFDAAFGQESKTASGTELETGSAAILKQKAKREAKPVWRQPTAGRPLDLFVTGDSEADLVGLKMADLDTDDLLDVETVARNGRVAVVMKTLSGDGKRPVYWVAPPTARDQTYNEIYRSQNRAVQRAAESVEGARYVDIFSTIGNGQYSDEVEVNGRKVLGRQSDGIHFNREGAEVPAGLVLAAMAEDYPALKDAAPDPPKTDGRTKLGE